jgi:hypothetical protein
MTLPAGFQPRACPFCGSRHLTNARTPSGEYKVTCCFCKSTGPEGGKTNDEAWISWSGGAQQAPPMYGSAQGVI